ncbi:hypothetical protein J5500_05070 [Candidatus Saccharibacteria bacterium]|nr:hypothetical protein [Candidatus Saccharibacteria bacterium]
MQDSNPPINPTVGPAPVPASPIPEPNPAPVTPPSAPQETPTDTAPPKKTKIGLIIGIIAVLLIAIIAVILVVLFNNNKKTDDSKKEDESSQETDQKNETKDEIAVKINGKSVTISRNFLKTVKSFINAGYIVNYTPSSEDLVTQDITSKNIDTIFGDEVAIYTTLSVDIEENKDDEENNIASIAGYYAKYEFSGDEEEKVKVADLDTFYVYLQPAALTLNNKKLDATTATAEDIQATFGKYDNYDSEDDAYSFKNIDGFSYDFFMIDGKIDFIAIRPENNNE